MEKRLILTTEGGKKTSADVAKPGRGTGGRRRLREELSEPHSLLVLLVYSYVNRVYRWLWDRFSTTAGG
jgi:hypothetical protein